MGARGRRRAARAPPERRRPSGGAGRIWAAGRQPNGRARAAGRADQIIQAWRSSPGAWPAKCDNGRPAPDFNCRPGAGQRFKVRARSGAALNCFVLFGFALQRQLAWRRPTWPRRWRRPDTRPARGRGRDSRSGGARHANEPTGRPLSGRLRAPAQTISGLGGPRARPCQDAAGPAGRPPSYRDKSGRQRPNGNVASRWPTGCRRDDSRRTATWPPTAANKQTHARTGSPSSRRARSSGPPGLWPPSPAANGSSFVLRAPGPALQLSHSSCPLACVRLSRRATCPPLGTRPN